MAVLAYVAEDVRTIEATSQQLTTGVLGETGVKGQPVRQSSADNKYYLVDGDMVDPVNSEFAGYLLQSGIDGDSVGIQIGGEIYLGINTVPGMLYTCSATKGQTEECTSSVASGLTTTLFGYGKDAGTFNSLVIYKLETVETVYP